jgi:GNAT superfamily N-acetyltransferase
MRQTEGMAYASHPGEAARLRDGAQVLIGPLGPDDAPLLADAFARLSEESRRLRFLGPKPTLTAAELRYLTDVDGRDHAAICAVDPTTGRGIGIGRFVRDAQDPTRAEVAITVADEWQRRGLGRILLERLADRARQEGVRSFTALVSDDNRNMRGLLQRIDAPVRLAHLAGGVAEWEIELAPRGLGVQLEEALRAAAAGHLQLPPSLCETLRELVPLHLDRRLTQRLGELPRRFDLHLPPRR